MSAAAGGREKEEQRTSCLFEVGSERAGMFSNAGLHKAVWWVEKGLRRKPAQVQSARASTLRLLASI